MLVLNLKFVSERVEKEIDELPKHLQAKITQDYLSVCEYGEESGLTRKLKDKLFEIRTRANKDIARSIFTYENGNIILVLVVFVKKTQKTPPQVLELAQKRLKEHNNGNSRF